jgi:hypothetical protein
MSSLKQQLYQAILETIGFKIDSLQQAIHAAQADAQQETKSSAGDKYETGRAMMHLEVEKLSSQLSEMMKGKKVLDQIDPLKPSSIVQLGSVIITSNGNYFLSISGGTLSAEGKVFFCISPASPMGSLLTGKRSGDTFTFRNQQVNILDVL